MCSSIAKYYVVAIDYDCVAGQDWANCEIPDLPVFPVSEVGYQMAEACYFQFIQKWQRIFLYEWESCEWEYIKYDQNDLTNIYISLFTLNSHKNIEKTLKADKVFSAGGKKDCYSFLDNEKYLVDGYGSMPDGIGICLVGGIDMPKLPSLMPEMQRCISLENIKVSDVRLVCLATHIKIGEVISFVKTDKPIVVTHEKNGKDYYYLACSRNGVRSWLPMGFLTRCDADGNPIDDFRSMVWREPNIKSLYQNLLSGHSIVCDTVIDRAIPVVINGFCTGEIRLFHTPSFKYI